jgi:small subunit ribosomal protein S1
MLDQFNRERDLTNPDEAPELSTPLTNFDYSESEVPNYDQTIKVFSEGDIIAGTVVKVDKDEVLLDIGYKSEGVIPARELSIRYGVKAEEVVKVGDEIDALVLQKEDKEGRLILSKKRAQYERSWDVLERKMLDNEPVEGEVIEVVKGGLILDIGLRGFLPASLIDVHRVKELQSFLGSKLVCKIIEMDRNRNNVVLSRRAFLEETASERRKILLDNLEKGNRITGKVSSIVSFGAFVNLGGIDGLIHISELSWCHVEKPSEVLSVGDEVEVEILEVDKERERISLSLKACQADPWEQLSREVEVGEVIQGVVTKLVPFGVFVQVRPGIEGLVHISELSRRHVEQPEEVVAVNQAVEVKVIDIDIDRRRISLSLKQTMEEEELAEEELEAQEVAMVGETESEPLEEAEEAVGYEVEAVADTSLERAEEPEEELSMEAVSGSNTIEQVASPLEKESPSDIEEGAIHVEIERALSDEPTTAEGSEIEDQTETAALEDGKSEETPEGEGLGQSEGEEAEEELPEGSLESIIRDMKREGI